MYIIYCLIGFGLGYLFGKLLEKRNLSPRNWGYKLLLCFGTPLVLYGITFLIAGILSDWSMYIIGSITAVFFVGCIAMLVSMLIFINVKKRSKSEEPMRPQNNTEYTENANIKNHEEQANNKAPNIEPTTECKEDDDQLPPIPSNTSKLIQLELNGILKGLFLLWMVTASIYAIGQFIMNTEGSYAIGAIDLVFSFIGIIGLIGMYKKKRWGLFMLGAFYALQVVFCVYLGKTDATYYDEAIKVAIRFVIIWGLLFIRKNGYSAWKTIWNNGELIVEEQNETKIIIENIEESKMGEEVVSQPKLNNVIEEEMPPISDLSSEITTNGDKLINIESPVPNSEKIVDEASKNSELSLDETHTNQSSNGKYVHKKKGIIIIICIITTIIICGLVTSSVMLIPKNNKRKAIEELYLKGRDASDKKLYELAIKYFSEANQIDSSKWELKYALGNCYYWLENNNIACKWYEEAYELNHEHKDKIIAKDTLHYKNYLYRYANSYSNVHPSSEKSILLAQEYYSLYPDDYKAYHLMIKVYGLYAENLDSDKNKQNKYRNLALQWGKKMVEIFPDNKQSYQDLALVQFEKEDYLEAITNYKICIELSPSNAEAYNVLGCCYEKLNDYQKAYSCWRKAVQLGDNIYATYNLERHRQSLQ